MKKILSIGLLFILSLLLIQSAFSQMKSSVSQTFTFAVQRSMKVTVSTVNPYLNSTTICENSSDNAIVDQNSRLTTKEFGYMTSLGSSSNNLKELQGKQKKNNVKITVQKNNSINSLKLQSSNNTRENIQVIYTITD